MIVMIDSYKKKKDLNDKLALRLMYL